MGNFVRLYGTNLTGLHCYHRGRVSIQQSKLHFVSKAIAVNMHDSSHIARFQPFGWNGDLQNDTVVFFNHTALCGYAVTNLAVFWFLSTTQMVFTRGVLPPGD